MTRKNAHKRAARARQSAHGGKYAAHHRLVASKTTPKPWSCSKCKQPIKVGEGYILVMDAESNDYPRRATPEERPMSADAPAADSPDIATIGSAEIFSPLRIPNPQIEFAAYHFTGDPDPDKDPYGFAVERAQTLESWCGWVHHLCEKRWMGRRDLRRMIAFWFDNRGINVHKLVI